MTRPRLAVLAFLALLGTAARAQPGPGGAALPAPDLSQLAAEVGQRPTDARTVHLRMRAFLMSLRRRGIPPGPEVRRGMEEVRRLLGEGRLTPAARVLDGIVREAAAEPAPGAAPAAASAPAPAAAAALRAAAPAGREDLATETPRLLSAPPAPPAAAPAAPSAAAAAPELTAFTPAARAQPAPAPGFPWGSLAVGLGALSFAGAGVLLWSARGPKAKRLPDIGVRSGAGTPPRDGPAVLSGKYELGRVIASGGMGEVYDGRDLSLRRRVAVKRMLAGLAVDEQLRAQFLKEALFVAKLTHPYIVPIHDAVDEGGDLYLVFEFVEGETLARRLTREARLPLKEARRVMSFVAKAVDYAHGRHVLHRDIKPGNIMLGADGIARVMDFGIALESTRTATAASAATGGFLDASGTLRYMPPEQHYGKSVRQSDVYAMGVCLYETVTGHPPFAAATVDELLALKRAAKYPPPSSVIPGLPTDLDLLVASALAPDAARRVSSAAEFLDLLEGLPA